MCHTSSLVCILYPKLELQSIVLTTSSHFDERGRVSEAEESSRDEVQAKLRLRGTAVGISLGFLASAVSDGFQTCEWRIEPSLWNPADEPN